jgi:hypothetical protein
MGTPRSSSSKSTRSGIVSNGCAYCAEIHKLEGHFEGIEFQHVPHNNNVVVDILSKLGSKRALVPAGVFVQDLSTPSIKLLDLDNPNEAQPTQIQHLPVMC